MEKEENFFAASKAALETYIQDRIQLLKLQTIEKTSRLASVFFTVIILGMMGVFILLFISLTIAAALASLLGSLFWGYGIVAIFYIILAVIVIAMRRKVIEKKLMNALVNILFEKEREHEHDA